MISTEAFIPRIALFISDPALLTEAEGILRARYSSLLIITEKKKLVEFPIPLIIVVDRVKDVFDIRKLHPVEGTRILVIQKEDDSEANSAAFEVGADDVIGHPFAEGAFVGKIEKYLKLERLTT